MTTGRFGDDELIPSEAITAGAIRQSIGEKQCPFCGAPFRRRMRGLDYYTCGTARNVSGASPSKRCLRASYAQARERLRAALAREARFRRVLEQVEWEQSPANCPICDGYKSHGHTPDCELAAALSSAQANPYAAVVEAAWDVWLQRADSGEWGRVVTSEKAMERLGEALAQLKAPLSHSEAPQSRAHPGMGDTTCGEGAAPPAAQERPERAFGGEGRE